MSASGGLSKEEFLVLQEQLIALRNRNYELQESLQKKNQEIAQLSSPKSDALQFASKLMNRRDKEKELMQKYEAELDALRVKLTTQEEEFRLQQKTLITELNKVVSQNQSMQKELDQFKSCASLYSSPQAGTPCESFPFVPEGCVQGNVSLDNYSPCAENPTSKTSSETSIEQNDRIKEIESSLAEREAVVAALENKLLEYKERMTELDGTVARCAEEKSALKAVVDSKEAEISSISNELNRLKDAISEKDELNCYLQSSISSICKRFGGEDLHNPKMSFDRSAVERELSTLMESISLKEESSLKNEAEKASLLEKMSLCQEELEAAKKKCVQLEEGRKKEKDAYENKIALLSIELSKGKEKHEEEIQSLLAKSNATAEELKNKLVALEESGEKQVEDRVLLLETRYQLELSDREKSFEKEREEWVRKLRTFEASLAAKDEEKAMSLKKQAALVKELQRALREEKKRAESMEKQGLCCSEERGWHLVSEPDAKSAQTLDGADSHSISSASALESDNAELINRLTSLQRTHADAMDRINILENENLRLSREVEEKRELIEHWIRKRPLVQGGGAIPSKQEGSLRRFLTTTLTGDDATNDVREMNRKLQRMLEETLSKNIILQRVCSLRFSICD
ncbi:hypothetical protein Y032_0196g1534 [Ancylostoma ceylanicum]|uniref:GRIP domain-containing protein n=2 Tax=Ancylostoma ceylanicum TaxID=53326 RepID=A0A016SNH3_9BILA|nr:hypothetical protein Y032_0196g1534 [Ancylostoma ceylanicum]